MMGESNASSSHVLSYTTGGYLCTCGIWVGHDQTHVCGRFIQPYVLYEPMTYTTIESGRLTELMEAERKLNEIRRILGCAFG